MRFKLRIILSLLTMCGSTSLALSQAASVAQPCSTSSLEHKPALHSDFNPRLNATEVRLLLPRSACNDYDVWVRFNHPGRALKPPKEVIFSFTSVYCPPNVNGYSCHDLKVVLDGKVSLSPGKLWGTGMHVIYDDDGGGYYDGYVILPTKTFLQISRAKKIHIIIGTKEFDLSEENREAMHKLADSIEAAG